MVNIIDYGGIRSTDIADLTHQVAFLIQQRWQPFGSLTSSLTYLNNEGNLPAPGEQNIASQIMYAQALVKYA